MDEALTDIRKATTLESHATSSRRRHRMASSARHGAVRALPTPKRVVHPSHHQEAGTLHLLALCILYI
jgi:hypothetical protein